MGKKLEFNQREQEIISNAIMAIGEILFLKMDDGVATPTLDGTIEVDNENKTLNFSIIAKAKE